MGAQRGSECEDVHFQAEAELFGAAAGMLPKPSAEPERSSSARERDMNLFGVNKVGGLEADSRGIDKCRRVHEEAVIQRGVRDSAADGVGHSRACRGQRTRCQDAQKRRKKEDRSKHFSSYGVMLASEMLKLQNAPLKDLWFFLDFDGSLCPHLEVWEERTYDPHDILGVVDKLARKSGGMYWNTGRRPESLGSVLPEFLKYPGYFIQGSLRWDPQQKTGTLCGPPLPAGLAEHYQKLLQEEGRLRLEVKASSLRIAPYQSGDMSELAKFILKHPLPPSHADWVWHVGARGAELLSREYNKGFAIRDVASRVGSEKRFKPVVIGDDLLDRPAVEEALSRQGYAILVGEHCGWATEIEHKAWQVEYFNEASQALEFLRLLGA